MNGYRKLDRVSWSEHRNNDGDSFYVNFEGEEFELRLYFVDTPEKYLSDRHERQRDRVADQADDLDISLEQAVTVGKAARKYVATLLKAEPFTVYTNWERVYDDDERYHGFVEIPDPDHPGKTVYLCELLVRKGLGRIFTRGEDTPDGRHWRQYKDYLFSVEKGAQRNRVGAWSL
ncbi:MAG: thermonuclease family protein [Verrucomicrobiales bacterium]|nr:thermonuclease family protein [Verrucomicrobiales bacterium]